METREKVLQKRCFGRPVIWVSSGRIGHTLIFEGEVRIDMRYVCPKDVKKMHVQQARTVYWKKWKHRNAARKYLWRLGAETALRHWLVRRK